MKQSKRKIQTLSFPVSVAQHDIDEGECLKPNSCMVRVAVERMLRQTHPRTNHHTRVDGGHIKFNHEGYRYVADTPRKAKAALISFDKEDKARKLAKRKGDAFHSKVAPFNFQIEARRTTKIRPVAPERQEQINTARRTREASGSKPKRYTLRERIVGFA